MKQNKYIVVVVLTILLSFFLSRSGLSLADGRNLLFLLTIFLFSSPLLDLLFSWTFDVFFALDVDDDDLLFLVWPLLMRQVNLKRKS